MKNHLIHFYAVPAVFVIAFLWTNSIQGRNVVNSKCRSDRPIVKNFDAKKFIGKCYEIYRYDTLWQKYCECVTANYTVDADGSMIIRNCCYKVSTGFCVQGKGVYISPNQKPLEAKFDITFDRIQTSPRYTILDTGYDNYAIIFDCAVTANHLPVDTLWVNSRTPQLNPAIKAKVEGLLDEYFNRTPFITTNQEVEKCSAISWMPPMNHQPL